jgi:hypothetical protein
MGWFRRRASPEQRFATEVLDTVRVMRGVTGATYDAESFAIRYKLDSSDGDGWIYLHNTFRETLGVSRAERIERIRRLVSSLLSPGIAELAWPDVRHQLRPVLRGVGFGQGAPGERKLLSRPALPYLVELVVVDQPTLMAYVMVDRLAEWGVSAEEVFATARSNLAERAHSVTRSERTNGPVLLRFVDDGDMYFTSMLLVPGFLSGLASHVGGRPVAFVPDKDNLTVVADDPMRLPKILEMVETDFRQAPRSLSPVAYTVDDRGAVVPYVPVEPGELANRIHRATVLLAANEYNAQKEALDAAHKQDDTDIFVASVLVVERPDKSLFSVGVWADNVAALVPEADFVAFQSEHEAVTVPWAIVARELRLEPAPGFAPARYRVTAWPAEPIMNRFRADAVHPVAAVRA